jgi:hypothetical protein
MNEENCQPQAEKQQNEELLRLMTGYGQHASQKTINFPEYRP